MQQITTVTPLHALPPAQARAQLTNTTPFVSGRPLEHCLHSSTTIRIFGCISNIETI